MNWKRIFKGVFLSFLFTALACLAILAGFFAYFSFTTPFDAEKLNSTNAEVRLFDDNGSYIPAETNLTKRAVKLDALPDYIPAAFLSIEDKSFYQHHGLNYKRIAKAVATDILHGSLKEGGSTITQQLIKNTHLSPKKTFSRKMQEIVLTRKVEKKLNKEEILESYLNAIYYGNGTYGIEQASQKYFSKHAKELALEEAATLAALIKAPALYCPINRPSECKQRRDLVLSEMHRDGRIDEKQYSEAKSKPISLELKEKNSSSYFDAATREASQVLGISEKQLALANYSIYTYYRSDRQKALQEALTDNLSDEHDFAGISVDNQTRGVSAFYSKSNFDVLSIPRQPGSCLKPFLVYAPALEEGKIQPSTMILDEEIDINGYKPRNAGGKFAGYVSIKEAVSKSINTVAVKTLSYVGIERAKSYCENMGIQFDESDNGYALALGGMTNGIKPLQQIAGYATLANGGKYGEVRFVKYISDEKGKIIYKHNPSEKRVFSEDTAYLVTDMLRETSRSGTAKWLNELPYSIASKTGTVGNSENNTDAFHCSYTAADSLFIWTGDLSPHGSIGKISGGNTPTAAAKEFYEKIYSAECPADFAKPDSVVEKKIDLLSLEKNHVISLANDFTPERFTKTVLFSQKYLPKERSVNFLTVQAPVIQGQVMDDKLTISFQADDYITYKIYEAEGIKEKCIQEVRSVQGKATVELDLSNGNRTFYVVAALKNYVTGQTLISGKSNEVEVYIKNKNSALTNQGTETKRNNKWWI